MGDHGVALERDLGYTSIYLSYNYGLHISTNGHELARLIEALVRQWPVPLEELVILGHSMGGLVTRSAYHSATVAGHTWPASLSRMVFLGTPHHGATLERIGKWVETALSANPYSAPFSRVGKIRSAGFTDMRYGSLLDEDWENRDRFELNRDPRRPVPLPEGVRCYAIAAVTRSPASNPDHPLMGDGLVSLNSALGRNKNSAMTLVFPPTQQWVGDEMNHYPHSIRCRAIVLKRIVMSSNNVC
jgi:pimeloyl-ACP methyl ester carboxylesterase